MDCRMDSLSMAILPLGPTAQGRLRAFQLLWSICFQVWPSLEEMSLPFGPTAIHELSF